MNILEEYHFKRVDLAKKVKHFWHYEDLNLDFQKLLDELKVIVSKCPEAYAEQYRLEVLEIETTLRDDCLIE